MEVAGARTQDRTSAIESFTVSDLITSLSANLECSVLVPVSCGVYFVVVESSIAVDLLAVVDVSI